MGLVILSLIGWLLPTIAGIWFLNTLREMRNEIRMIRRYLQAMADRPDRIPAAGK